MKVNRNETIAGIGLIKIRDFLRRCNSGFGDRAVAIFFKVEEQRKREIENALIAAGYVAYDGEHKTFSVTDLGSQLSNAKFANRISRSKAEELVRTFLRRVDAVNLRDELTHRVAAVRVFGSYLSDASDLGDVDLAVDLKPRRSTHVEESLERAEKSGKSIGSHLDRLFFGQQEVKRLLKERQPHISIHEYEEPDQLKVPSKVLYSEASS